MSTLSRLVAGFTVVMALGGCSDPPSAALPPGALSLGTAEVSLGGAMVDTTHSVKCSSAGPVTTIETGDDGSGTTSAVDTADGAAVQFAEIRNLGGFTGSYWAQLDPSAHVDVTGRTYVVSGTANGFDESNPSARLSQIFSIRVAC